MKKIIITLLFIVSSLVSYGQVKCICEEPEYEMVYKRTVVRNNDVIMDFTMTYHGKGNGFLAIYENNATFYDDEGNIYEARQTIEGDRINMIADIGNTGKPVQYLESGIPIKVRITLKDVDEFATKFVKIRLSCAHGEFAESSEVLISNVPIPRN